MKHSSLFQQHLFMKAVALAMLNFLLEKVQQNITDMFKAFDIEKSIFLITYNNTEYYFFRQVCNLLT
jgi:hypothetical protein